MFACLLGQPVKFITVRGKVVEVVRYLGLGCRVDLQNRPRGILRDGDLVVLVGRVLADLWDSVRVYPVGRVLLVQGDRLLVGQGGRLLVGQGGRLRVGQGGSAPVVLLDRLLVLSDRLLVLSDRLLVLSDASVLVVPRDVLLVVPWGRRLLDYLTRRW